MVDVKAKPFSDEKRWVVIYPTYLDSKKSLQQGRKIPKELGVENPTSVEIFDVLSASGLNPVLERGKLHPREQDREPEKLGRVRVMLKNDDGTEPRYINM
ncbi:SRP19 protein [Ostertagia ostertagi]